MNGEIPGRMEVGKDCEIWRVRLLWNAEIAKSQCFVMTFHHRRYMYTRYMMTDAAAMPPKRMYLSCAC
jgi:hypothetical protein